MEVDESWASPPSGALGALFLLKCPVCGFDYNHFQNASYVHSNDKSGSAWMGRGDLIRLTFRAECGHHWSLCLGYHKGQIFVYAEESMDERPLFDETSHEG
jgi:hypothetical protein